MAEEKDRVLTKAEQRRMDRFTEVCREMEEKGYKRNDLIIDLKKANLVITLVSIPFTVLSIYLFWAVNRTMAPGTLRMIPFLLLLVALTVVHELIHGLAWSLYCENGWKDIEFGFIVKTMNPYCTCAAPLLKAYYIIGALAPLFVLGVIPYIAGLFMGNLLVFSLGAVMILGAGGDIMLVSKLLAFRCEEEEEVVYDHPTEAGSVMFTR